CGALRSAGARLAGQTGGISISGRHLMDRLKGKVALISGGARGQGAAEAGLFVAEGARVVIGDVLDDQAAKTAQEINAKAGGRAIAAVHLDVTRAADWRAAVNAC